MFEIGGTELLLIVVVALIVIGPKDLPNALRTVGRYTGKARAMTRHLRAGFDEMMRQAELEEMEKQWAEHNRRVMAETPAFPAPEAQTFPAPEAQTLPSPEAQALPASEQPPVPVSPADATLNAGPVEPPVTGVAGAEIPPSERPLP